MGPVCRLFLRTVERALGLTSLARIYDAVCAADSGGAAFAERSLARLGARWEIGAGALETIPARGPLLVVANHPFGAIEGMILHVLVARLRSDVRILGNALLARIPELRASVFALDAFGGQDAARRNVAPLRQALAWLAGGGALLAFPAGAVAHFCFRSRGVCERPWPATIGRLIQRSAAAVAPIYIEGRNSVLFQAAGVLHPRLRTALLGRELLRAARRTIRLHIGSTIPFARLKGVGDAEETTRFVRQRTLCLGFQGSRCARPPQSAAARGGAAPIAAAAEGASLAAELAEQPPEARLLSSGEFEVFCCRAAWIPRVLREIGRLREVTFRAAGEGVGREVDLDRFDERYWHLFVWRPATRQIIGAYRLGRTDEILPRQGVAGLYTSTLFRYGARLLREFGPAIEAGRSFVIGEYQRSYTPLLLLWKGLGRLVVRWRCRVLFGAVSISADYESTTKSLLIAFLRAHHFDDRLAAAAQPRNPPRLGRRREAELRALSRVARDILEVDELVRELETEKRGAPILVRQYLRLNARMLGFNVDPDFSDVIDGLFYIDLVHVQRSLLNRYLGVEGADTFMRLHGGAAAAAQSESAGALC